MINLVFNLRDGGAVTLYDVHPNSQAEPVIIPDGAVSVSVYLGIGPAKSWLEVPGEVRYPPVDRAEETQK